jgi:hypothetical protein
MAAAATGDWLVLHDNLLRQMRKYMTSSCEKALYMDKMAGIEAWLLLLQVWHVLHELFCDMLIDCMRIASLVTVETPHMQMGRQASKRDCSC